MTAMPARFGAVLLVSIVMIPGVSHGADGQGNTLRRAIDLAWKQANASFAGLRTPTPALDKVLTGLKAGKEPDSVQAAAAMAESRRVYGASPKPWMAHKLLDQVRKTGLSALGSSSSPESCAAELLVQGQARYGRVHGGPSFDAWYAHHGSDLGAAKTSYTALVLALVTSTLREQRTPNDLKRLVDRVRQAMGRLEQSLYPAVLAEGLADLSDVEGSLQKLPISRGQRELFERAFLVDGVLTNWAFAAGYAVFLLTGENPGERSKMGLPGESGDGALMPSAESSELQRAVDAATTLIAASLK